ncbi:MAG: AraC family transcriptional regulator [Myxococcota bacterium]
MDVLSDVLSWLRVEGTLSRRSELSAPWGISYPRLDLVSLMVVEKGTCALVIDGATPLELEPGDLVVLFPGRRMSLVDQPATPVIPYAQVLAAGTFEEGQGPYTPARGTYPTLRYGGGGRATAIRGWGLRFRGYDHNPLLPLLPPFVHITYEQRSTLPWLETTLRFLLHETHARDEGSDMMVVRLVDLLFVQVLRSWLRGRSEGEAGWLGALRDQSIGRALQLIHASPAEPWSVERMARAVGMSRSSFASRFHTLVGASPKKYLTQVRMNLAANALRDDPGLAVGEVASRVGYDTESSFGRAFKRTFDASPGAFRKRGPGRMDRGSESTEVPLLE